MKKAYDRVEWIFFKACMLKMGFDEKWVNWVMLCVKTSFSVKINGESQEFFQPTRGIKRGDSILPYLFISMANTLSILMKKAIDDDNH